MKQLMARIAVAALVAIASVTASAAPPKETPLAMPDIAEKYVAPTAAQDYDKRDVMIRMRDGVKLHTVIVVPRGAANAPIILTRTPYNASGRAARAVSPRMLAMLPEGDDQFVAGGYIRVFQDIRGKYGSEGDYFATRPVRGPLNKTKTDHATDAYDTIAWLVKHVPESNGRVGMVGSSYEGFTVLMALTDPHPALRAAVPMSPMVDGWRGDDWFHNGAFRLPNLGFYLGQMTARGAGETMATGIYDDYDAYLRAGSARQFAKQFGLEQVPFARKVFEHPNYDAFWQEQALDRILAKRDLKVPTMTVVGQWDQEDIYGAYAVYAALEPKDPANDRNYLVIGPWRHSGVNYAGYTLGPLKLPGDTALQFRRDYMLPFLDQHLKEGAPKADTPPVLSFQSGADRWQHLQQWPVSCESGCASTSRGLYLREGHKLSFDAPTGAVEAFDEYRSDPAKPVPFVPRPVRMADPLVWKPWLVSDQRSFSDRPDVLTYVTDTLNDAVAIAGEPQVDLYASTTGTDADWVVKLIDVYPDEVPSQPELGGYQLGVAMEIFRGRFRDSLEHPSPIPANTVQRYRFALPNANHVFLPGHRIMVQIQSSWFPLYDRNPQTYVDNIFDAQPADYRAATQRVHRDAAAATRIELPVVDATR
jgi:uncharacterized protein